MRDYIIFAIVFGLTPFMLIRPAIGVHVFTWISLMNPHRLTYGPAYSFPFAAVIAVVTLAGLLFARGPKRFPFTPLTCVLILFILWMTTTCYFALEPNLVWKEWDRVMKTLLMIFVAMMVLHSEQDIKIFAWVVALSIGFYGFKGGVFTLASGGSSHVFGPDNSYITDNNALALALVTALPLVWYLQMHVQKKWLRLGLIALCGLTAIAAVGSYSRGALLAGAAMLFFLWTKSSRKLSTGIVVALLVPLIYFIMPEQWFGRMETIDNYQEDASAMGRINAWYFAINVAKDHFLGGGYNVFTPNMFLIYAPEPLNFHVSHSIYFQVLGEHGIVGLILFLVLMALGWRTGSRILKMVQGKEEYKWAADLAAMCQVSIIGYAVGGAFLALAYYDLYYDILVLLVVLEKYMRRQTKAAAAKNRADAYARPELESEGTAS
jgi:probable O-glycosylation ligase (exosortase A-associated)